MSTRSNTVIKKVNKNGEINYAQLYRHHDGMPTSLGQWLTEYMAEINVMSEAEKKKVLKNPVSLAKWLAHDDRNDEYEYEGTNVNLHGDIEYLYVIDLTEETITCYSTWDWNGTLGSDEDKVNGELEESGNYFMCYVSSMWDSFDSFKEGIREEFDDEPFGFCGDDSDEDDSEPEDEETDFNDWPTSELMGYALDEPNMGVMMEVLEGYVTKQDLHEILAEYCKAMEENNR